MLVIFIVGYLAIAAEHFIKVNKAATALITGAVCWVWLAYTNTSIDVADALQHHLAKTSEILFFLLGAMTIVELIDAYQGFDVIAIKLKTTHTIKLLWLVAGITFVLSSVLDNLTTTIVMITIMRKLINQTNLKVYFAGIIIIAANAGGAWSPIGDVTTTMLWIGNQISEIAVMQRVFLPAVVAVIVPLIVSSFILKEKIEVPILTQDDTEKNTPKPLQLFFLCAGLIVFLLVPVFKIVTHLPPYLGMLLGLGVLWLVTEVMRVKKSAELLETVSVHQVIQQIDTASILFFMGILLSIGALESGGYLQSLAVQLQTLLPNTNTTVFGLGLLSSIIDNVPLVAATQGMYPLSQYPIDQFFWHFVAYCSGTGGSILVIGSAAGVAAMGMLPIQFFKYIKQTGWLALLGYVAGALVCLWLG
jgi:Na+/H+ antiporter NhaD/arsenite permease-like protein